MSVEYSAFSDSELISRVDQPEAFAELESRYLWLIRAKACTVAAHAFLDRDDLVQEGLVSLYCAAKSYHSGGGASFATYAGVCVYNRMSNAARNHRSRKNAPLNEALPLEQAESAVLSPELILERREDFAALIHQIHVTLSDFERKVLGLYLSGAKRGEVLARYDISLRAFDNAMHRVRKKLKSC